MSLPLNQIVCGDCIEVMKTFPKESIDIIITSPPYEDIASAGYSGKTKDVLFLKLYSEFMDKVFSEIYRILKPTGQIFFNIKSKTHDKTLRTPHWLEFLETFRRFKLKSYIIWKYAGSFDSTKERFHLDYEVIYHLSKTHNIFLNDKCGMNDPLSSVWYVPHNIKKRLHPTQMPEALVERILRTTTKNQEVVLDIFAGCGTTCVVAGKLGRRWIGIDINPEYCEMAKKRLMKECSQKLVKWT